MDRGIVLEWASDYEHLLWQVADSTAEPEVEEAFLFNRGDIEGNETDIEDEVSGDDNDNGGDDEYFDFDD